MIELDTVTSFLGWCTLLNFGFLAFAALWVTVFRETAKKIHSKMSGINPDELDAIYFNFLANYKLAFLIFNLTPYIALKIMA